MPEKSYISQIKDLTGRSTINLGELYSPIGTDFTNPSIISYLKSLQIKAKPESALSSLFEDMFRNELKISVHKEVNIKNSFVDFQINEKLGNPVLIEIKTLFKRDDKDPDLLKKINLQEALHLDQIKKYIRDKQYEYVILTNMDDAYLYSRDSLFNDEFVAKFQFFELLEDYNDNQSIWDFLKRKEDNITKPELENEFFETLKENYELMARIDYIEDAKYSKDELIVLFLNKIIFIKTLEDFGLIKYRYLLSTYEKIFDEWDPRGFHKAFKVFFFNFEEFFKEYYNTELFKFNFWDYVEKSESNIEKFKRSFDSVLGFAHDSRAFSKGLLYFNYRKINEDVFGKAYETFIAKEKKDSGIFYTHYIITNYMANGLVDSLFDEKVNQIIEFTKQDDYHSAQELMQQLYDIKITDTTSGSGSFLIKVLRRIYEKYKLIDSACDWLLERHSDLFYEEERPTDGLKKFRKLNNFRLNNHLHESEIKLVAKIILRHIYASDLDDRALETAKTNIWKEAVKLNPKIYNYRNVGKLEHILPNLEMNFICGDALAELDQELQLSILSTQYKEEIKRLYEIKYQYLDNPFIPEIIEEALEIKAKIRKELNKDLIIKKRPLNFCLEYFEMYFNPDGSIKPKEQQGFTAIISNPPWEALKPIKKEFAGKGKGEMIGKAFEVWFGKELKKNAKFKQDWQDYQEFYSVYNQYMLSKYKFQSAGDLNLYKLFLERDMQLLKQDGLLSILIPSGVQTDQGGDLLRNYIFENTTLSELSSFENRGYIEMKEKNKKFVPTPTFIFPDVDNRFKFTILNIQNTKTDYDTFKAKFYLRDPNDLYNDTFLDYKISDSRLFSPKHISIMEFRSQEDYDICLKIADGKTHFSDLGFKFRSEFHMTNDNDIFESLITKNYRSEAKKGNFRLYEGKLIHQYTAQFANQPNYLVSESAARERLISKVKYRIAKDYGAETLKKVENWDSLKLDYQTDRLAYRAIGRSTDERTFISSIVPKNVFLGHSLNYLVNTEYELVGNEIKTKELDLNRKLILLSLFNSFTLNYYLRNKVSANLTMNFINELPIAELNKKQEKYVVERALAIFKEKNNPEDFPEIFALDSLSYPDPVTPRAELEVFIANTLYGINKTEWEHIAKSFSFGGKSNTKKELDEIFTMSMDLF